MINSNMRHPSAFISSTFTDLKHERQIITQLFKALNIVPQALDTRPASNNSSKSEIIRGIRESDFIVLIVANKYGTMDKNFTGSDKKSITWWEYDIAMNSGKSIIPIFKNGAVENDNNAEKAELLNRFKNLLTTRHSPQYFDTDEELYHKVLHSIIPAYRNHSVREVETKSVLTIENERLKSEIQLLRSKLESEYNPPKLGLSGILADHISNTSSNPLAGLSSIANWGKNKS